MAAQYGDAFERKKKQNPIDREMTTALLLLRAVQLGISVRDLELLTVGMVNDMYIEAENDKCTYNTIASQDDMDRF